VSLVFVGDVKWNVTKARPLASFTLCAVFLPARLSLIKRTHSERTILNCFYLSRTQSGAAAVTRCPLTGQRRLEWTPQSNLFPFRAPPQCHSPRNMHTSTLECMHTHTHTPYGRRVSGECVESNSLLFPPRMFTAGITRRVWLSGSFTAGAGKPGHTHTHTHTHTPSHRGTLSKYSP